MKKIIFTEFFTTISYSHFLKSIKFLTINLFLLKKGKSVVEFENTLLDYLWLENSKILSFYNWRSALFNAFKIIWIKKNDEIIVNWYNCISVINSIIQSKAIPIYCDISKFNFWLDIKDLENKITKKTKIIIIQHTFWKSSKINEIISLANKHNILVIEDCAHSLWSEYNWKKHWTFWDFSLFSTWRDKVISWVNGGFLIINNNKFHKKYKKIITKLTVPNIGLLFKNHLYNIFWFISFKTYTFLSFWKALIFTARKLWLFNEVLTDDEKKCKNKELNLILPNSLAALALSDFWNIEKDINHRRVLYEYYYENINNNLFKVPFFENKNEFNNSFRVPLLFENNMIKDKVFKYMSKQWIILGYSWSSSTIAPLGSSLKNAKYTKCKKSEDISSRLLLLPNHKYITIDDAKFITDLLNNFKV